MDNAIEIIECLVTMELVRITTIQHIAVLMKGESRSLSVLSVNFMTSPDDTNEGASPTLVLR